VGFNPARDFQPLVEFGAVKRNKTTVLVLTDQHVKTLAEILRRICEAMCGDEQYGHKDGDFKLNTTGSYMVARMYLQNEYISLTLVDLQRLSRKFHVVQNELKAYTLAMPDVLSYATEALFSTTPVSTSRTRSCSKNSRPYCKEIISFQ
jgi:hypothetical protein